MTAERAILLKAQRNEITEHQIYCKLARKIHDAHNKKILDEIAEDELAHYRMLKSITNQNVQPDRLKVRWYLFLTSVLGITFSLKLMEKGEELAVQLYRDTKIEVFQKMLADEQKHEEYLLSLMSEERIAYASSIVLGLNDALVELTAALAGLTLALENARLIALIGLITGVAAALSMASSEYLSSREEETKQKKIPAKAAVYTGAAYFLTVLLLISPYLLLGNVFLALPVTIAITLSIIAFYTFYISTAKDLRFRRRFAEMAAISLGVAAVSFAVGWVIRIFFVVGAPV